ncbi:hypothetical protein V8E54_011420 [Elaphomyces granulatus]
MAPIERITMFKIPNDGDRDRLLEQYKVLAKTAVKDGKLYIQSLAVGPIVSSPRAKGYTLAVKSTFATLDDMNYYDMECAAHVALKAVARPLCDPEDILTAYYESVL